jgi:hypothetical protein
MIAERDGRGQLSQRAWLSSPSHLCHPPPRTDQQKAPVVKKLGRLAFEGMSDELEYPTDEKERKWKLPEADNEDRNWGQQKGKDNQGNANRVAEAID